MIFLLIIVVWIILGIISLFLANYIDYVSNDDALVILTLGPILIIMFGCKILAELLNEFIKSKLK